MNEIINNPVLWLICSVTVFIVALQAGLCVRLALRNAQSFGLSREKCFKAFRIGMVTAFGPSLGILIVMVGLMTVLGEPLTWMRLSMIVSAANELTAAQIGAQAVGIEFNSPDFGTAALFVAWFGMAINGIGSLVGALAFSGSLEKMKEKINAYNPKILLFVSGAAMASIYGNLSSGEIKTGGANLAAWVVGGVSMYVLQKIGEKFPKIKEYNLGLAMILGTIAGAVAKFA